VSGAPIMAAPVGRAPLVRGDRVTLAVANYTTRARILRFNNAGTRFWTRGPGGPPPHFYVVDDEDVTRARGYETPEAKALEAMVALDNSR
jgi:hypothetical protein